MSVVRGWTCQDCLRKYRDGDKTTFPITIYPNPADIHCKGKPACVQLEITEEDQVELGQDRLRDNLMKDYRLMSRDYTPELLDKVEEILKAHLMMAWQWVNRAVMDIDGTHTVILDYPIKSPSLDVYDNLTELIKYLKKKLESTDGEGEAQEG